MTYESAGILAILVALLGAWLHGRSSGKQAAEKQQADASYKEAVKKIEVAGNQDVADDIAKRAGK